MPTRAERAEQAASAAVGRSQKEARGFVRLVKEAGKRQGVARVKRQFERITGRSIGEMGVGIGALREVDKLIARMRDNRIPIRQIEQAFTESVQRLARPSIFPGQAGVDISGTRAGRESLRRTGQRPLEFSRQVGVDPDTGEAIRERRTFGQTSTPEELSKAQKRVTKAGVGGGQVRGLARRIRSLLTRQPMVGNIAGFLIADKLLDVGSGVFEQRRALEQGVAQVAAGVQSPSEILDRLAEEEALQRRAARLGKVDPDTLARLGQALAGGSPSTGSIVFPRGQQGSPDVAQLLSLLG